MLHLRHGMVFLDMLPIDKPEAMIAGAASKFDAAGTLTDEVARRRIGDLLAALAGWTRRLRGG